MDRSRSTTRSQYVAEGYIVHDCFCTEVTTADLTFRLAAIASSSDSSLAFNPLPSIGTAKTPLSVPAGVCVS